MKKKKKLNNEGDTSGKEIIRIRERILHIG